MTEAPQNMTQFVETNEQTSREDKMKTIEIRNGSDTRLLILQVVDVQSVSKREMKCTHRHLSHLFITLDSSQRPLSNLTSH